MKVVVISGLFFLFGCGSSNSSPVRDQGPATEQGSSTDQDSSNDPDAAPRPEWRYGNAQDEQAACELYANAESIYDDTCQSDSVLKASRRASCTKFTRCNASGREPDFIERSRKCYEEKVACTRPESDVCDDLAGATYPAGAAARTACATKKSACKQAGTKFKLACDVLGGTKASLLANLEKCFAQSVACSTVRKCVVDVYGPECAGFE